MKRTKIKVVILGPAWATMAILKTTMKLCADLGYEVSVVPYRGHYGDTRSLEDVTLGDFEEDTLKHIESITQDGEKVILLGISMGSAIAHRIAEKYPNEVRGVVMYGSPMFSRLPVWKTLLRIFLNWTFLKGIVTGKGTLSLSRRDAEDFLFEGTSGSEGLEETLEQPASARAMQQMLLRILTPNKKATIPYVVLTCIREMFHHNTAAFRFAKMQGSKGGCVGRFGEVEGGHFSALFKKDYLRVLKEALTHIVTNEPTSD